MRTPAASCGTRASRTQPGRGTDTLTSRVTSEGSAGSSTRPAGEAHRPAPPPIRRGALQDEEPRVGATGSVAATSWASGSGWPATSNRRARPAGRGRKIRRKRHRGTPARFAREVPAAAQPWVAAPSAWTRLRKRENERAVRAGPDTCVRSPCASITCACTAPAHGFADLAFDDRAALLPRAARKRKRLTHQSAEPGSHREDPAAAGIFETVDIPA